MSTILILDVMYKNYLSRTELEIVGYSKEIELLLILMLVIEKIIQIELS